MLAVGLVIGAGACGGNECACGLPDGDLVFVGPASDGTCGSLVTEASPYEYGNP